MSNLTEATALRLIAAIEKQTTSTDKLCEATNSIANSVNDLTVSMEFAEFDVDDESQGFTFRPTKVN